MRHSQSNQRLWSPTKERKMFVHGRPSSLSWIPDQQQGSRPRKVKVGSDPQAARTKKRNRIEILLRYAELLSSTSTQSCWTP